MATWAAAGVLALVLAAVPATTTAPEPAVPVDLGGVPVEPSTDGTPTTLTAGLWADTLSGPGAADDNARRYRYVRTIENSAVLFGVAATSPEAEGSDELELFVETVDGVDCADDAASSGTGATASTFGPFAAVPEGEFGDRDDPCLTATELRFTLRRGDVEYDSDLPVTIRVVEEAPVLEGELPQPEESPSAPAVRPTDPRPVEGGSSFDDAPELTSGTYDDTLPEGRELLYRVRLGWGQALGVRVDVPPATEGEVESFGAETPVVDLALVDPLRSPFDGAVADTVNDGGWDADGSSLVEGTPPVAYLNRVGGGLVTVPGDYWVSLASPAPEERAAVGIPVEITVEVLGEPGPAPAFRPTVQAPGGRAGPAGYDPATPYLLGAGEFGTEVSGTPRPPAGAAGGSDAGADTRRVAGGAVGLASLLCLVAGVVLLRRRVSRPAAR